MKKVGITGGIGAGKSMVSRIFQLLDVPVFNADDSAKRCMEINKDLMHQIISAFGSESYLPDGKLNKSLLASVVFKNPNQLEKLNSLVHPVVMKEYQTWIESQTNVPYTIREAAILFESGTYTDLDIIILVDAPEELRLRRTMNRDGRTEEEVRSIMLRQWDSAKKRKASNFIIENDEHHALIPQVLRVDEKIRNSV